VASVISPNGTPIENISIAPCANLAIDCKAGIGRAQNESLINLSAAERQRTADYLGQAGTNYQRIALLAASAGRSDIALAYEIAAVSANAMEQMIRPSMGKVSVDAAMDIAVSTISSRTGIPRSVLFEISEQHAKPLLSPVVRQIDGAVHR
jgi:hypothetical protein